MLDADVVGEQARNRTLEAVELREGVLPDRQQDVHAQVGVVDDRRELAREGARAVLVRVVEEVVLELVQDDEQRADMLCPRAERLGDRVARTPATQLARRPSASAAEALIVSMSACERIVAPGGEHAHCERRALGRSRRRLAQLRREVAIDARSQERCLPDPARPVEQRQARGAEVAGDDPRLAVATEEERSVALAVRDEPDERRLAASLGGLRESSVMEAMPVAKTSLPADRRTRRAARTGCRRPRGLARGPPRPRARPCPRERAGPPTTSG